ncbi:MAG: hypothetical protein L0Y71_02925 [Gemmataceae bacterium]|nr:hypothetical protein [Gemmataceae bacterium]
MTNPWPNRAALAPIAGMLFAIAALSPSASRADELADRAAVIKPSARELAWLKIPWVLDLNTAQQTAKAEARPIFLWVTGDDPLGRC